MSADLYSVRLKGEVHTFPIDCWASLTIDQIAPVLSDVTGYRESHIRNLIIDGMQGNAPGVVEIIHAYGWDGKSTPSFLVCRLDKSERLQAEKGRA